MHIIYGPRPEPVLRAIMGNPEIVQIAADQLFVRAALVVWGGSLWKLKTRSQKINVVGVSYVLLCKGVICHVPLSFRHYFTNPVNILPSHNSQPTQERYIDFDIAYILVTVHEICLTKRSVFRRFLDNVYPSRNRIRVYGLLEQVGSAVYWVRVRTG